MKIEHGIPIPKRQRSPSPLLETLRVLEVDDSVLVPFGKSSRKRLASKLQAMFIHVKPKKFTTRQWPTTKPEGIRVWRVK